MRFRGLSAALLVALLSLIVPVTFAIAAELQGLTSTSPATAGGIGGQPGPNALCPEDQVVVGLAITPTSYGTATPDFNFYCRALDEKGAIDSDRSSAANSTLVSVLGSGRNSTWCPAGHIAIGVQFVANKNVSGAGLVCSTPPRLADTNLSGVLGSGSITTLNCPTRQVLVGFNVRSSTGIERLGGYCSSFKSYRLFYATNGAIGKVPNSIDVQLGESVILPPAKDLLRVGFQFQGWTDGTETYQPGDTYFPKASNVTISAIWKLLPPTQPDPPQLEPGVGQIEVSVSRPENSARVTFYLVSSPDGVECTIRAPENSCVISGLSGNRRYSFTVIAGNDSGRSEPSEPAYASLVSIPDAPQNLEVSFDGSRASLNWDPPSSDGGSEIRSYLVVALQDGEQSRAGECRTIAPETRCEITGLVAGRGYRFSAVAINDIGESAETISKVVTLAPGVKKKITPVAAVSEPFVPVDDPEGSLDLLVTGYALLLMASTMQRGFERHEQRELAEVNLGSLTVLAKKSHWGDKSRSWTLPGGPLVEGFFSRTAERAHRFTEVLGRSVADGSYIRAMFGSAYLVMPMIGLMVGLGAARSSSYLPLPPSAGWLTAAVAVAVVDSFSGVVAAVAFALTVVIKTGALTSPEALTVMGLAAIMFAPPLIASNARPFRRLIKSRDDLWERISDFALASLFAGWAVSKMINGLPTLAGLSLPITEYSKQIGVATAVFMAARLLLEEFAQWAYPARLIKTTPKLEEPWRYYEVVTPFVKTAVFIYLTIPFVGTGWALFGGTAIFLLSETLSVLDPIIPKSQQVQRWLPKGSLKTLTMVFVGVLAAKAVSSYVTTPAEQISIGFVVLALPLFFLKVLTKAADPGFDSRKWRESRAGTLIYRMGGVAVFIALAMHALGYDITAWLK